MLKIGITGELGSGKTYISNIFQAKGVPYYNCDERSKQLLITIPELIQLIKAEFGEMIYEGNIYKNLANFVFIKDSDEKLNKLVSLINPFINADIDKFYLDNKYEKFCLIETATLYEVEMDKKLDRVIYIYVPEELRIKRAFQRSGLTEEDYRNRMKNQITSIDKIKRSNYIISNYDDFDINMQIEHIYTHLTTCDPANYIVNTLLK